MRLWIGVSRWIGAMRCRLLGHDFYQRIGGYESDGMPYPEKGCRRCDFTEDLR
jgi:hypothetical protein